MSTSVAIETNDLGQDRLLSLSGEEDGRQETAQLIRFSFLQLYFKAFLVFLKVFFSLGRCTACSF